MDCGPHAGDETARIYSACPSVALVPNKGKVERTPREPMEHFHITEPAVLSLGEAYHEALCYETQACSSWLNHLLVDSALASGKTSAKDVFQTQEAHKEKPLAFQI